MPLTRRQRKKKLRTRREIDLERVNFFLEELYSSIMKKFSWIKSLELRRLFFGDIYSQI
jgi:hypothetical protein